MAKFHLSASGPMPCKASLRDCPVGGRDIHFDDYAEAVKEYETRMESEHGFGSISGSKPAVDETNVGAIVTDFARIKQIEEGANEFQYGHLTPYLDSEHSVYFKKVDDYYTEVAVLGEDSQPVFATSFDFTQDREAVVERLGFMARFSQADFGVPSTEEQVANVSKLYDVFKAHGGDTNSVDPGTLRRAHYYALRTGVASEMFDRETENVERTRKSGRRSYSTTEQERTFITAVLTDYLKA
jgi:hypothetical protein